VILIEAANGKADIATKCAVAFEVRHILDWSRLKEKSRLVPTSRLQSIRLRDLQGSAVFTHLLGPSTLTWQKKKIWQATTALAALKDDCGTCSMVSTKYELG
jgi:hypothetical protein